MTPPHSRHEGSSLDADLEEGRLGNLWVSKQQQRVVSRHVRVVTVIMLRSHPHAAYCAAENHAAVDQHDPGIDPCPRHLQIA